MKWFERLACEFPEVFLFGGLAIILIICEIIKAMC